MIREPDSTTRGQTADVPTAIEVAREGGRQAAFGARIRDRWSALEDEGEDGDLPGEIVGRVREALGRTARASR
jgi:hypothetical protein